MLVELNLLYKLNYCLEKSFFESRVFINLSAFINNNFLIYCLNCSLKNIILICLILANLFNIS